MLAVAEPPELNLLRGHPGELPIDVAVPGHDRAVLLKPRRVTNQHPVLEPAVPQPQHVDELLAYMIDDGLAGGGRLSKRRGLVDPREVGGSVMVITLTGGLPSAAIGPCPQLRETI